MPAPLKNRAIIVLGMHRSGTSAFAGVLSLLGVDLGSNLLPASATNQSGYWEHEEVVNIHDQLLMALGSSWDDPAPLPAGWLTSEPVAGCRERLLGVIRRDFAASPLWAIKDPRLCRLLPLWIPLLAEANCEPVWILLVRHPSESIRSLEKRDGFPRGKSELLWLAYTLDAERETQDRTRVIITMDQLMSDWQATMLRVEQRIGLPWPVSPQRAAAQIGEFLDPGKRHHRAGEAAELSPWTRDTFDGLIAGAEGNHAKMSSLLQPAHAAFAAAEALYWPFIRSRAGDIEKTLAETNKKYAAVFESGEKFKEKHRESKEKLAAKTAELKARKDQLAQFERSPGGKLNRVLAHLKPSVRTHVEPVNFPDPPPSPDISIIVSAGGDLSQTARCLLAVRTQTKGVAYELLAVADSASVRALGGWKNVRTISNEYAAGFGEAHNRAARQAAGQTILFLDQSVIVESGWCQALVEPLRSLPLAGIVGAEAGMLKPDGAIELFAAQDSAALLEADFCTTACLAISRNLFFQAGGFDGNYLPVEEVNLGIKIRRTRRKVIYQPRCPITKPERQIDAGRLESARPKLRRWAEAMAKPA